MSPAMTLHQSMIVETGKDDRETGWRVKKPSYWAIKQVYESSCPGIYVDQFLRVPPENNQMVRETVSPPSEDYCRERTEDVQDEQRENSHTLEVSSSGSMRSYWRVRLNTASVKRKTTDRFVTASYYSSFHHSHSRKSMLKNAVSSAVAQSEASDNVATLDSSVRVVIFHSVIPIVPEMITLWKGFDAQIERTHEIKHLRTVEKFKRSFLSAKQARLGRVTDTNPMVKHRNGGCEQMPLNTARGRWWWWNSTSKVRVVRWSCSILFQFYWWKFWVGWLAIQPLYRYFWISLLPYNVGNSIGRWTPS